MNLLPRLLRLPIVAANPVLAGALWIGATALTVSRRAAGDIPAAVQRYDIISVSNAFIRKFLHAKAADTSMFSWFIEAAFETANVFYQAIRRPPVPNAINANNMPNIMAGTIQGNALVQGLGSNVFVIGFSPNMINAVGFIFMTLKGVFLSIVIYKLLSVVLRRFQRSLTQLLESDDAIDIKASPVNKSRQEYILNKINEK